jgi:hypothetical protein
MVILLKVLSPKARQGEKPFSQKRVIDATGDADVAYRAGGKTIKTPREEMIAVSVMFSMSGVNKREFIDHIKANPTSYRDWDCGE